MKQTVWVLSGLVGFLLILGIGFSVGQILSMGNTITALESRIDGVESGSGSSSGDNSSIIGDLKVGVVRVDEIALRFQGIPEVAGELQAEGKILNDRIEALQTQVQNGEISEEQAAQEFQAIQQASQNLIQISLSKPIQDAVNQVGLAEGYHLITKVEDVILFSQGRILEDITEKIWEYMEANR
jgi:hypothetical protein